MNDTIVIKSAMSKGAVIEKISELSGNHGLKFSAPFSGRVREETFRLSRTRLLAHPFVPVAAGHVKIVNHQTVIEFTFAFPWLGHASVLMMIAIILSMPLPSPLLWQIMAVILFAWGLLIYRHRREKVEFLKFFKESIS